ncbi:MAG: DUF1501 domain-containing protein [Gemmataceae bacterium]|nr:DUF1501 domain-containing protein [Gemmataceae bacterium]
MEPLTSHTPPAHAAPSHAAASHATLHRRQFLTRSGLAGASWLTMAGHFLARADETRADEAAPARRQTARSIIVLWLEGGPSQLETFDPHPGTNIAAGTGAIDTAVRGVQLAPGLERTAGEMASIALVRSMVSREGDHERAAYTMKTGYRPDPTVVHPSIGAILCHELPQAGTDIPRHVSILPGQWPARGGFLGNQFDAFRTGDPAAPVPDTASRLTTSRDEARLRDLDVVERAFARRRQARVDATLHRATVAAARQMMSSEQLRAFDVSSEPIALRRAYGDTPFGRACLAARRLTEVGVRCVEVTLSGWDTHANNHALCQSQLEILDPALSTLVRDLRERQLLDRTLVLCAGEFGRTPNVNLAGGRDHWPNGFSVALAGGGIRPGAVVGATDPEGRRDPADPVPVADLFATVLTAAGIDITRVNQTPIGRTVRFSDGRPVAALLRG